MNIANYLASVSVPGGLWSSLINWFQNGIGNFGWTILLVTIFIKLITSPLDFWTKYNTKKQTLIQQKCSPQIAKIKKKFGANQEAVRVQTNALYKKEGLNPGVGCVVSLIHVILSLVIFFTFYSSLRANSAYQAINQYEILEATYDNKAYEALLARAGEIEEYTITSEESADEFVKDYVKGRELLNAKNEQENQNNENTEAQANEGENSSETPSENQGTNENENPSENEGENPGENEEENKKTDEEYIALYNKYKPLMDKVQEESEQAVLAKWDTIKSNWIWIENIWVADSPTKPFLTYNGLVKIAANGGKSYSTYVVDNINPGSFTEISDLINEKGSRNKNGFYILAILVALLTFLSQFIAEVHTRLKSKKAKVVANASMGESLNYSMKMMKFIMPIIMIIFVLQSSASFGIYLLGSNIAGILFGEIINFAVNKITHKKQVEVEAVLEKEANRLIKKGKLQEKK